mgnify:CR=1 FL=1
MAEGRRFGGPDLVEFFDANQRVLVGGVLMVKLVLDEAVQFAEFGEIFSQHTALVHAAEDAPDLAPFPQDGEENVASPL